MHTRAVKEDMSKNLITIGWDESMSTAYSRMKLMKVRHLPVQNESGDMIGILSERDVQRSMISKIENESGHLMGDEVIRFDPSSRVRNYMSWPAEVVDQKTDLRLVAERMMSEKISSFLVSEEGKVVGIVTTDDLLRVLVELLSDSNMPLLWTLNHVFDRVAVKPD